MNDNLTVDYQLEGAVASALGVTLVTGDAALAEAAQRAERQRCIRILDQLSREYPGHAFGFAEATSRIERGR